MNAEIKQQKKLDMAKERDFRKRAVTRKIYGEDIVQIEQ